MTDNNKAFIHILVNVLIWSLFPVLSLESHLSDPWAAIFYSQLFGLLFALIFSKRKSLLQIKMDIMKSPGLLLILSTASLLLCILFVLSLESLNPIGAAITLELWPFFALIFSIAFIKKNWDDIAPLTFGLFLLASIGVAALSLLNNPSDNTSFFGILLAIFAAIASGATVVQTKLYFLFERKPSFPGACYTIALVRLAGLPIIFAAALIAEADFWSIDAILAGCALGITAFGLASVMAISGLRYSTRTSHILLWYLTPVIASAWLFAFSESKLSDIHILAFMPILFANIFSNIRTIRRISFFLMSGAALVIGTMIYTIPSTEQGASLSALGVSTSAYAIIVAFLLQRKLNDIRELGFCIARGIDSIRNEPFSKDAFISAVEQSIFSHTTHGTVGASRRFQAVLNNTVNEIKIERATSFSSAEIMVLGLLTASILIIGLFFRAGGFIYDIVSFSVCFTAVFLTSFVVETSSFKFQWRVAKVALEESPDIRISDRDTVVLSLLGVSALLVLILTLLVDKWMIDLMHNDFLEWLANSLN